MEEVTLQLNEEKEGSFTLLDGGVKAGEMVVGVSGKQLKVYHTEILPEWEGKGLSKKLLDAMVSYARENKLTVNPLCTYVQLQFKRHPEEYADLWKKN